MGTFRHKRWLHAPQQPVEWRCRVTRDKKGMCPLKQQTGKPRVLPACVGIEFSGTWREQDTAIRHFLKPSQRWDLSAQVSSVQLLSCSALQIPLLLIPARCGTGLREKEFYKPRDSKAKGQAVAPPYPFLSPTETVLRDQKRKTVAQSTSSGSLSLTSLSRDQSQKHQFWHQQSAGRWDNMGCGDMQT